MQVCATSGRISQISKHGDRFAHRINSLPADGVVGVYIRRRTKMLIMYDHCLYIYQTTLHIQSYAHIDGNVKAGLHYATRLHATRRLRKVKGQRCCLQRGCLQFGVAVFGNKAK